MAAEASYVKDADVIKVLLADSLASGEVRQLPDGRAGVYVGSKPLVSGDEAAFKVTGQFDVIKTAGTAWSDGDDIWWDYSANAAVKKTLTGLDGDNDFYLGKAVGSAGSSATTGRVNLNARRPMDPVVYEFDCETGVDGTAHVLIPPEQNPNGLLILGCYGIVTEVFAGGTEDQGIVTIKDTAGTPNTISTLTAGDSSADAIGDVIVGTGKVLGASTGDAVKSVAAGLGVTGTVTQPTTGTSKAGKMKVYVLTVPLV